MASVAQERTTMTSERSAPGMLPRLPGSFDMVVFVAIVLFIVNASAVQPAGPAAFTYRILGFLAFLIPGALVTSQLGQMFPHEGSLYVWTQKVGVIGVGAAIFGAYVTFRNPWTPLYTVGHRRLWLGILVGVSALAAIAVYVVSEFTHRRRMPAPSPEPTPVPG